MKSEAGLHSVNRTKKKQLCIFILNSSLAAQAVRRGPGTEIPDNNIFRTFLAVKAILPCEEGLKHL